MLFCFPTQNMHLLRALIAIRAPFILYLLFKKKKRTWKSIRPKHTVSYLFCFFVFSRTHQLCRFYSKMSQFPVSERLTSVWLKIFGVARCSHLDTQKAGVAVLTTFNCWGRKGLGDEEEREDATPYLFPASLQIVTSSSRLLSAAAAGYLLRAFQWEGGSGLGKGIRDLGVDRGEGFNPV